MGERGTKRGLRVLAVEDSEADLKLVARELERGGFEPQVERVETAEALEAALARGGFELIVSDWEMPLLTALQAIAIARARAPDVPLIIVSGAIGEETAVQALKSGAVDFVMKDRLARLVPAVERELREARGRRARREAEQRLLEERRAREAEERYRRWLDSIPPLAWRCDARGAMLECNQRWLDHTGMCAEAVRGDGWLSALHPDDRARAKQKLVADLAAGRPFQCEYRVLRAEDGTYRRYLARALPEKQGAEGPVCWTGTATDIEDQKRAEEALRASEARFRHLVRVLPVAVYTCDTDRRVTTFNEHAAALWGGRPASDEPWCDSCRLFTSEGAPLDRDHCPTAEALRGRSGAPGMELVLERADGARLNVIAHPEPIWDAGGEVVGAVNVLVDITRIRETERALRESERRHRQLAEALQEADRRKDEFLAVLSHELRNPLAPIRNALYLLDAPRASGEQLTKAKTILARQVGHLTRLVDDLLDVTRIARGKVVLQRSRLELAALVRRAVEDHRAEIEGRGLELSCAASEPSWVDGDETRLAQVVGNLLVNAAKFTERGRIRVEVGRDGARALIRVADTGVGIAPELLERLFEPFFQIEDGVQRSRGGLGLGLALVRGLVALHGGEVEARSEGPGRGAEFVVRLPRLPDAAAQPRPAEPPAAATAARRILIVEDNADAADSLRDLLGVLGHDVAVVHGGRAGVDKARQLKPDLVICDIGLPELNGFEVAERVRADAALGGTVLVALSGYTQPEDRRRALAAGFDFYLAKPASLPQLQDVLARVPAGDRR